MKIFLFLFLLTTTISIQSAIGMECDETKADLPAEDALLLPKPVPQDAYVAQINELIEKVQFLSSLEEISEDQLAAVSRFAIKLEKNYPKLTGLLPQQIRTLDHVFHNLNKLYNVSSKMSSEQRDSIIAYLKEIISCLTDEKVKEESRHWISLEEVVLKSLKLMEHKLKAAGIEVQFDDRNLSLHKTLFRGLERDLISVFVNLIDNSIYALNKKCSWPIKKIKIDIKFAFPWEELQRIERAGIDADAQKHTHFRLIRFSDNGCGMPQSTQASLFQYRFTTKGSEGSGLGLSDIKERVEKYGGKIAVDSVEGIGTLFSIYFPTK